ARANPRSLPCVLNGFPAPGVGSDGKTCNAPSTPNPSFRNIDYHVPTSASGVADLPGGNVLITLGLWDKILGTGTPFLVASTPAHEFGHNFGCGHVGDPRISASGWFKFPRPTQFQNGKIVNP